MSEKTALSRVKKWLQTFVVGMNLCPFAKRPFAGGKIRYVVVDGRDLPALYKTLASELLLLQQSNPEEIETTLIILEKGLDDFYEFLYFLEEGNKLLNSLNLSGTIQIASFHMDYQFEGTQKEDPGNYTNRSPFPILHLLRESSVEKAISTFPDIEGIPQRNIEKMKALGIQGIKDLQDEIRTES